MLSIIVAVGKNLEIGKNNKMLWHITDELKHFKKKTEGHTVIMGRKTFESIGNILPNRKNIVLSKNGFDKKDLEIEIHKNFKEIEKYKYEKEEYFIIGGFQIYKESLDKNLVSKMYVSHIDYENESADTYFPEIDDTWLKVLEIKNVGWTYCEYIKKDVSYGINGR